MDYGCLKTGAGHLATTVGKTVGRKQAMRRFHISKRKSAPYLLAEFVDPLAGRRTAARPTKTRDRTEAVIIAME